MQNTLFLFLFLSISSIVYSQNFSISITGGINASYFKFEANSPIFPQNSPYSSKPGFMTAIEGKLNLNSFLAFRGGVNYLRKGATNKVNLTDENGNPTGDGEIQTNVDYISLPILVETYLLENDILFFNVGYSFDFMQQAETKYDYGETFQGNTDETNNFTKVDYSLLVGLGVQVPISEKLTFLFEGRWQNSLTDIYKAESFSLKNRSVFAASGIRYNL